MVHIFIYRILALCMPRLLQLRRALLWCADAVVPAALPLYEMTTGLAQTQMVASFVAFRLPERLCLAPATLDQLCQMTSTDPDVFARYLRACQSLGLLRRDRRGYFLATARTRALCPDTWGSMRAFGAYMAADGNVRAWQDLHQVIVSGQNAFSTRHNMSVWAYFEAHPHEGAQFAAAMTALTRTDGPAIAHAYPFGRHPVVCDVGGGQGALLQAILGVYPKIHGVVLDQAHVAEHSAADAAAPSSSIAQRLTYIPGSFFNTIPPGYDAYVLRHVLHDWDDAACSRILDRCRRAMRPGARLLIIESRVEDDDTAFLGAMKDLTMAVVCGGRERGKRAVQGLLAGAGLRLVRIWSVAATVVIWEATHQQGS